MLGVVLLTGSWCIFLPWTTGDADLATIEGMRNESFWTHSDEDQPVDMVSLLRGAAIFLVCWAWGIWALLRCPCGLRKKHLVCVFCCVRSPEICPRLFAMQPKHTIKRGARKLKVKVGKAVAKLKKSDGAVVAFAGEQEGLWADLGDATIDVAEWLQVCNVHRSSVGKRWVSLET